MHARKDLVSPIGRHFTGSDLTLVWDADDTKCGAPAPHHTPIFVGWPNIGHIPGTWVGLR